MMLNNLSRWLEGVALQNLQLILRKVLQPLYDRASSLALNTAGLVIKAGGGVLVKTGAADCYCLANGVMRKITAATDMPALAGTVTNAAFNVWCFFIDSGGTVTSVFGTEGTTLALMKFPQFPVQKALIGYVLINPTGTGNFVGGTTALDDATVVPGAVYVNGAGLNFDPYALIGAGVLTS